MCLLSIDSAHAKPPDARQGSWRAAAATWSGGRWDLAIWERCVGLCERVCVCVRVVCLCVCLYVCARPWWLNRLWLVNRMTRQCSRTSRILWMHEIISCELPTMNCHNNAMRLLCCTWRFDARLPLSSRLKFRDSMHSSQDGMKIISRYRARVNAIRKRPSTNASTEVCTFRIFAVPNGSLKSY